MDVVNKADVYQHIEKIVVKKEDVSLRLMEDVPQANQRLAKN